MGGMFYNAGKGAAQELADAIYYAVNKMMPILYKAVGTLKKLGTQAIKEGGLLGKVVVIGVACALVVLILLGFMLADSFRACLFFWLATPISHVQDVMIPAPPQVPLAELATLQQLITPWLLARGASAAQAGASSELLAGPSSRAEVSKFQQGRPALHEEDELYQWQLQQAVDFDKRNQNAKSRMQDNAMLLSMGGYELQLGATGHKFRALEDETASRLEETSSFFSGVLFSWKVIVLVAIFVAAFIIHPAAVQAVLGGVWHLFSQGFCALVRALR